MSPDTRFRGVEFVDTNFHLNPGPRSAGDSHGTTCMVFTNGPWKGWICYKHPDGQWVSRREADKEDLLALLDKLAVEVTNEPV